MSNLAPLLPPNASDLERKIAHACAAISDLPTPHRDLWNPDACPARLLPWLAQAFRVEQWDADWSEVTKRAAIKRSVHLFRHKGTIGAVRQALAAIGVNVEVQEWFNQTPHGAPYTFRLLIKVDQVGISQEDIGRILFALEMNKNLRSHLEVIVPTASTRSTLTLAAVTKAGAEAVVTNGVDDLGLLMEGAVNGFDETEQAVDALHTLLHETLPSLNYW